MALHPQAQPYRARIRLSISHIFSYWSISKDSHRILFSRPPLHGYQSIKDSIAYGDIIDSAFAPNATGVFSFFGMEISTSLGVRINNTGEVAPCSMSLYGLYLLEKDSLLRERKEVLLFG